MPKKRFKSLECPNCGARYVQASQAAGFCPGCGQENRDLDVPVWHLVEEAIESVFHLDTKSFRTAKALALQPGFLTAEFLRGRRARYVPPARLYVLISFVFFLILALPSGRRNEAGPENGGASETQGFGSTIRETHGPGFTVREIEGGPKRQGPGLTIFGVGAAELRDLRDSDLEALMRARHIPVTPLRKHLLQQMARVGRGGDEAVKHLLIKSLSSMMFLLMPFFGFLVFVLFRKSAPHYVASLVFSLHYHSFAFLLLAALSLLTRIPNLGPLMLLVPFVLGIYLFIALRVVYRRGRLATLLAVVALGVLHLAAVLLLYSAALMAGILLA